MAETLRVGDVVELTAGDVAHGGHVVARAHTGQVVFVRHAIPGERVTAQITGTGPKGRYVWADAIRIHDPSPDRVTPPCPAAGHCGGCDWQHVSLTRQRDFKAQVVSDALGRFGGLTSDELSRLDLSCRALPGDEPDGSGLAWRDRVRYTVSSSGHLAMRRHRSHDTVQVQACLLGSPSVQQASRAFTEARLAGTLSGLTDVEIVEAGGDRDPIVLLNGIAEDGRARVSRDAGGHHWQVRASGFWQRHRGAAEQYVRSVRTLVGAQSGERIWDLYSGVGLFAVSLADDVGPLGSVDAVESDLDAVRDARRNAHEVRQVRIHADEVAAWLAVDRGDVDAIVLDPPRAGAGAEVIDLIATRPARRLVYVACDPVALARDTGLLRARGWVLTDMEVWDAFPMTHHVEAIAAFTPARWPAIARATYARAR